MSKGQVMGVAAFFIAMVMGLFVLPIVVFPKAFGYEVCYYALAVLTLLQLLRFLISVVKGTIKDFIDNA